MKIKIIVTGAGGQLGSELKVAAAAYPQYEFIFLTRSELAIENAEAVNHLFETIRPGFCINCAAYTAVDKAETDTETAFLINATATGILAEACRRFNSKLIHISTDYVFNGISDMPYKEEDATNPVNLYGASKLQGEELALKFNPDTIIIRTSWVYSVFGNNFVKTMRRLMREKDSLNIVNDQYGSPTYAADLANAINAIIASGKWFPGVYHYSNEGNITWYEFAGAIKPLLKSDCKLQPVPSSAFPTPAKRPRYSVMSKEKIKATYQIVINDWRQSLEKCVALLDNSSM